MLGLLNFVAFYAGWFACVLGAARGLLWVGPAAVSALVALHLVLTEEPGREARLILTVGALGFVIDTMQATLGVLSFGDRSLAPWLCPPWMVALWMIFASTLNGSMRWLSGRYALAAGLGAVTGPLSYYYGVRLGAIEFHHHAIVSLTALAVVWAATMPALLRLTELMPASRVAPQTVDRERGSTG